jgi:hypothetical protein
MIDFKKTKTVLMLMFSMLVSSNLTSNLFAVDAAKERYQKEKIDGANTTLQRLVAMVKGAQPVSKVIMDAVRQQAGLQSALLESVEKLARTDDDKILDPKAIKPETCIAQWTGVTAPTDDQLERLRETLEELRSKVAEMADTQASMTSFEKSHEAAGSDEPEEGEGVEWTIGFDKINEIVRRLSNITRDIPAQINAWLGQTVVALSPAQKNPVEAIQKTIEFLINISQTSHGLFLQPILQQDAAARTGNKLSDLIQIIDTQISSLERNPNFCNLIPVVDAVITEFASGEFIRKTIALYSPVLQRSFSVIQAFVDDNERYIKDSLEDGDEKFEAATDVMQKFYEQIVDTDILDPQRISNPMAAIFFEQTRSFFAQQTTTLIKAFSSIEESDEQPGTFVVLASNGLRHVQDEHLEWWTGNQFPTLIQKLFPEELFPRHAETIRQSTIQVATCFSIHKQVWDLVAFIKEEKAEPYHLDDEGKATIYTYFSMFPAIKDLRATAMMPVLPEEIELKPQFKTTCWNALDQTRLAMRQAVRDFFSKTLVGDWQAQNKIGAAWFDQQVYHTKEEFRQGEERYRAFFPQDAMDRCEVVNFHDVSTNLGSNSLFNALCNSRDMVVFVANRTARTEDTYPYAFQGGSQPVDPAKPILRGGGPEGYCEQLSKLFGVDINFEIGEDGQLEQISADTQFAISLHEEELRAARQRRPQEQAAPPHQQGVLVDLIIGIAGTSGILSGDLRQQLIGAEYTEAQIDEAIEIIQLQNQP